MPEKTEMGTGDRQAKLDNSALEMIRSISDGSDDLLQQVVALFIELTPPLLQDIDAGLSNNEMERLRVAAHTLKSSAANLGATDLWEMARRLEAAARAGSVSAELPPGAAVRDEFEAVCRALKAELNRAT